MSVETLIKGQRSPNFEVKSLFITSGEFGDDGQHHPGTEGEDADCGGTAGGTSQGSDRTSLNW